MKHFYPLSNRVKGENLAGGKIQQDSFREERIVSKRLYSLRVMHDKKNLSLGIIIPSVMSDG